MKYTVIIEAMNADDPSIWQSVAPAEVVDTDDYDLDSPAEIAETTAANQNVADAGRVRVYDGAEAHTTSGTPLAEYVFDYTT